MRQLVPFLALLGAVGGCTSGMVEPSAGRPRVAPSAFYSRSEFLLSTWEATTCHTSGSTQYCAVSNVTLHDYPGFPTLLLITVQPLWDPAQTGIWITAIGHYAKPDPGPAEDYIAPGGWGGVTSAAWTVNPHSVHLAVPTLGGYAFFASGGVPDTPDGWAARIELSDGFWWGWDQPFPTNLAFVWRARNEDGSIVFECFQNPKGGAPCLEHPGGKPLMAD